MKTKRLLVTSLILAVVILPAVLLNDLSISKFLYNPENRFALFIQQYGELPGVFVLLAASIVWGFNNKSFQSKFRISIIVSSALVTTFLVLYSLYLIFFYDSDLPLLFNQNKIVIAISILAFILIYIILQSTIDFKSNLKIRTFAKSALLAGLIGYMFLVQPLKIFWGRVRFRDLDTLYSNFTLWYLPNGINGNQSFPSGHAAMGFMLLPLVILVWNKRPAMKSLVVSVVCMWGILVCLGRIVIGAHYATDVLFGSAGIVFAFIISLKIFNKELSEIKN